MIFRKLLTLAVFLLLPLPAASVAHAQDVLCDPAYEDCREPILTLIRNEQIGIDVAFWFMEDARYSNELIRAHQRGVPVRVLVDTAANAGTPFNGQLLSQLQSAGVPMRRRNASGILHWKMMLFHGQSRLQFSAANYSPWAFVPVTPYLNYTDEVIYFTGQDSLVNSFRTKYDDLWTDTRFYTDYANILGPLIRRYQVFAIDPELNFPPVDSFRSRSVWHFDREQNGIDVIMYRITDRAHSDAMIRAVQRGVPVRLLTEPAQYRDRNRYWHSWNVDRMYIAGVQIRHRAHAGLLHQKSVLLRSQGMTVFGSSNWTSPSSDSQEEHNYFTTKPNFYDWFSNQFERKWTNGTGYAESQPFIPLPPDDPFNVAPADRAMDQPLEQVPLTFNGGIWAHSYDVYFGTSPNPPLLAADQPLGPSVNTSDHRAFTVSGLQPGTTYYWRIVGKTMAGRTASGPTYSFTTVAPPPPPPTALPDIVLYARSAAAIRGAWNRVDDATAAGGVRLHNADAAQPKLAAALASPGDYFEIKFNAQAGRPYALWIRGRADADYFGNDSVFVQFSAARDAAGNTLWPIGTSSAGVYSIQNGNGAPLAGWGWEDTGWTVLGPQVYFTASGEQTIRIQRREDGISIDQIVLSPERFLERAPGSGVNDRTIYPEATGTSTEPPPPPPPPPPAGNDEIVLHASDARIAGSSWRLIDDPSAAGGRAVENVNAGLPKVTLANAAPAEYVELTFAADAGKPYRLWLRSRAQGDYYTNDSVHVQFSSSVDGTGAPAWRIGTTQSAEIALEDCNGCGLQNWGWQDNGWGAGVLGPTIRFATSGIQTIRLQRREDGIVVDQIVLSAVRYISTPPGALKSDTVILPKTQ